MSGPAATLAEYTDETLAEWFGASTDETWHGIILAEMDRRDHETAGQETTGRAQRHAARCARRNDPVTSEWYDAAYAQYLEAERDLRGNLAVRDAPFESAFTLWSGTEAFAMCWATEDLREWWQCHPRTTVTRYRNQVRQQREAWRDDQLANHDGGSIRHPSASSAAVAVPGARPDGDRRPGGPAGPPGRQERRPVNMITDSERAERRARIHHMAQAARGETAGTSVAVRQQSTVATTGTDLDGARVLDYTAAYLAEFASFASPAARDAVALWAAHSHVRDRDGKLAWRATPRLLLVSSEPGSGKTRVLEVLARLCPNVFGIDTEPTVAALAHTLGREHATVLCDEADVLFGRGARKEGVRAVLNSGYLRDGTVLKMRGSKADRVGIFGPVALAGLDILETATGGNLEALLSRCIRIRMSRARGPVSDLTARADRGGQLLRAALGSWASAHADELADAEPEMPEGVHGRTAQIWTPILAIAEAAGGDWPDRAWEALCELALRRGVSSSEDLDTMDELAGMFGDHGDDYAEEAV